MPCKFESDEESKGYGRRGCRVRVMRNEMKMKKSGKLISLLATFLLLALFPVETRASSDMNTVGEGNFEIEASATGNSMRECYEVLLDITNRGADMTGKVSFGLDNERIPTRYEQTVALPSGEKKQVRLLIPLQMVEADSGRNRVIMVRIKRENGSLAGIKRFEYAEVFTDSGQDGFGVGILSDDPGRLGWMDYNGGIISINGRQGNIMLKELKQDFTEADLTGLAYLVVDDIDTSSLEKVQIDCIMDWVDAGGALIIGTGARWETISGFGEDRLDIRVMVKGDPSSPLTGIDYGNSYVTESGGFGDMMIRQTGSGAMTVFPTGLGDYGSMAYSGDGSGDQEEFSAFSDNMYLLRDLYETMGIYAQGLAVNTSKDGFYSMYNLFNYLEEHVTPHFGLIRFLVILYVFLVGPIIYLILKKLKKRELIWAVIPALSFGFVVLIFLSGMRYQVRGLKVNTITVAEATGKGHCHTYFAAYKSGNKPWSAAFSPGYFSVMPLDRDYSYMDDKPCTVNMEQDKMTMTYEPGGSFKQIKMLALGENTASGDLYFEEKPGTGMISGELTNETGHDLKFVLVRQGDYAYLFKDVADQSTVSTEDISHREKKDIQIGGNGDLQNITGDYFYDRKYEQARFMAAIELGGYDIYSNESHTYCLGVAQEGEDLFDNVKEAQGLKCLYTIR